MADRTIDVHVKTLRKKFAPHEFIETVRGVGYRAKKLRTKASDRRASALTWRMLFFCADYHAIAAWPCQTVV